MYSYIYILCVLIESRANYRCRHEIVVGNRKFVPNYLNWEVFDDSGWAPAADYRFGQTMKRVVNNIPNKIIYVYRYIGLKYNINARGHSDGMGSKSITYVIMYTPTGFLFCTYKNNVDRRWRFNYSNYYLR